MDGIYRNIEEYNPNKKQKRLIVFGDMISDMLSYKKLNHIITKLFIRGRKLTIYTVFFFCAKKYWAKFYTLFNHENIQKKMSKQTSRNCT